MTQPDTVARADTLHVSTHPAVLHKLGVLRDEDDRAQEVPRGRPRASWLLGYEALAGRASSARSTITTPMEQMEASELGERIGLVPILRAGLGMVDAMLELMPTAQVWHLGLFRDERTLRPVEYYNKLPDSATVDLCLILDPMLATGGSATAAIDVLKRWGAVTPVRIKLVNLIAAPEGVAAVQAAHPDVADPLRGARPRAQREGLHHAGPRRRRRPPVRDGRPAADGVAGAHLEHPCGPCLAVFPVPPRTDAGRNRAHHRRRGRRAVPRSIDWTRSRSWSRAY